MRPRVLAEAEAELAAAMLYYEDCREGLGEEFYESVSSAMLRIAETPLRFPIYEGKQLTREFRRARLDRFPYINIRQNEIVIVSIAHTSREPGYWAERRV